MSAVFNHQPMRTAEELHAHERELAFLGTTRGICIVDPATQLMETVNPAFARLHGGQMGDFVGRPVTICMSGDQRRRIGEIVARARDEGFVRFESEALRLDGSVFPARVEILAARNASGEQVLRVVWIDDLSEQRAVEAAAREAHELFESSFAHAPTGIALFGLDGRFIRVNRALCKLLGRPEEGLIGCTSRPFTHPEDMQATIAAYDHVISVGTPLELDKRYVRPDGEVVWAATHARMVKTAAGHPSHVVTHFRDITAFKLAEQRQREATQHFETAFADAPIGIALVSPEGRFLKVNRSLCEFTGHDEERLLELSFQDITHPDYLNTDQHHRERLLAGQIGRYSVEKRYLTAQRRERWANLSVSLVRDDDGRPVHFISQIEDITERKRLQESLQHLADHDALTDLPNRRRFEHELERQVLLCQRHDDRATLMVMDLDGFKIVNDRHGHKVGDDLLRSVAARLRGRIRRADFLGRIGGDEFAAILPNVGPEQAVRLAAAFTEIVNAAAVAVDGGEVAVHASIGWHAIDGRTESAHDAFVQADKAMYRVKRGSAPAARQG